MSVRFRGVRLPLSGFSLCLDLELSARVTGVFGASGAGKTSLLELIAGLRRPAAGAIAIGDEIVTDPAAGIFVRPADRAVGYVPQDGALFPHLSVRENLLYGWNARRAREGAPALGQVAEVLGVAPFYERRIQSLSGGEARRVALGRALLAAPRLLLLDEPLSGLDEPLRERLLPYLAHLRAAFAIPIVYVSHEPAELVALCDDLVVLAAGAVVARGLPAELFRPTDTPRLVLRIPPRDA